MSVIVRCVRAAGMTLAMLVVAMPAHAQSQARPPETHYMPWAIVDSIPSGNVIDVRGVGLVRLAAIDDAGDVSRAFLSGILGTQAVRVIPTNHSSAGFTEALVYTSDGRCVNTEMLRLGYARVRMMPGFDRTAEFRGLQEDARRLKRGIWADAAPQTAAPPAPARADRTWRRFSIAAGGGVTLRAGRSEPIGMAEAAVDLSRAAALYLSAGYIERLHAASNAGQTWHAGGGLRITPPTRAPFRPYLRAGGGYMRITAAGGDSPRRDPPFWEAGAGLLITTRRLQLDAGYTFARVDGLDLMRIGGLLGIRF